MVFFFYANFTPCYNRGMSEHPESSLPVALVYHHYSDYREICAEAARDVGLEPQVFEDPEQAIDELHWDIAVVVAPYDEPGLVAPAGSQETDKARRLGNTRLREIAGFAGVPWVLLVSPGATAPMVELLQGAPLGSGIIIPPLHTPDTVEDIADPTRQLTDRAKRHMRGALAIWLGMLPPRSR
jgi:hypothetical protein